MVVGLRGVVDKAPLPFVPDHLFGQHTLLQRVNLRVEGEFLVIVGMVAGVVAKGLSLHDVGVGEVHEVHMVVVFHHLLHLVFGRMFLEELVGGHAVVDVDRLRWSRPCHRIARPVGNNVSGPIGHIHIIVVHGFALVVVDDLSAQALHGIVVGVALQFSSEGTVLHLVAFRVDGVEVVFIEFIVAELSLQVERNVLFGYSVALCKHAVVGRGVHAHRSRVQVGVDPSHLRLAFSGIGYIVCGSIVEVFLIGSHVVVAANHQSHVLIFGRFVGQHLNVEVECARVGGSGGAWQQHHLVHVVD